MLKLDYSFSKAYQDSETIKKMYESAFGAVIGDLKITCLDGGMKCAVYLISNGNKKVVLKISPSDQNLMLSYERNTMWWEVQMLYLMKNCNIPTPEVLYYDNTLRICTSSYFFMEYIEGNKLSDYKGILNGDERNSIEYEIGKICQELSRIEGNAFFIPSYSSINFFNNYEFVKNLFNSLISDAKSKKISIPNYSYDDFIAILDNNKDDLNNIRKICLVHSDIWDGNIIIKDGKVNGIVDFSDLYYCDELFNFYFHTLSSETSESFLRGYGKEKLLPDETIRIIIYRIFVILKMLIEKDYKHFGGSYNDFIWLYEKLDREMEKLNKLKRIKQRR